MSAQSDENKQAPAPGEVHRYALDKEVGGMRKDATGNWVQITDHWTVCMERDALARAHEALKAELDRYAPDNDGALRCACEFEPSPEGFPSTRLQVCKLHADVEAQRDEAVRLLVDALPFVRMRANRFDYTNGVLDREQDLAAVSLHEIRAFLSKQPKQEGK